jgi:hypothetical protein
MEVRRKAVRMIQYSPSSGVEHIPSSVPGVRNLVIKQPIGGFDRLRYKTLTYVVFPRCRVSFIRLQAIDLVTTVHIVVSSRHGTSLLL